MALALLIGGRLRGLVLGLAPCALLLGCSIKGSMSSVQTCEEGKICADAAVSSVVTLPVAPPVQVDPHADSGPNVLPECLGVCNPDDPQTLQCPQGPLEPMTPFSMDDAALRLVWDAGAAPPLSSPGASLVADAATPVEAGSPAPPVDGRDAEVGDASVTLPDAAMTSAPGSASSSDPRDAATDAALEAAASASGPTEAGPGVVVVTSEGGVGGSGEDVRRACQVAPNEQGVLGSVCGAFGGGGERALCASARDCAPGLACVEGTAGGQCLPYCCGGQGVCGTDSYCARKKLRGVPEVAGRSPLVPVCAPGEPCQLGEPFPCPSGQVCSCSEENACTIVDVTGTRACVAPGSGEQGDSCPCAAGYVCSQGTQTCVKLCRLQHAEECGSGWICQPGPSSYPEGWGLCVNDY